MGKRNHDQIDKQIGGHSQSPLISLTAGPRRRTHIPAIRRGHGEQLADLRSWPQGGGRQSAAEVGGEAT